jgi:hypothetical protein
MAAAMAEQLAVKRFVSVELVGARRQPRMQLVVAGEDVRAAARP